MIGCTPGLHSTIATLTMTSDTGIIEPIPVASSSPTITSAEIRMTPSLTPTTLAHDGYLFPSDVEDPIITEVIQLALTDRIGIAGFGGEPFCSYELLMPLQTDTDGIIKAYLQVLCNEFYDYYGVLLRGTGISGPVALTLEKREEGWSVEHQTPEVGNWGPSIREIFPSQTWPIISAPTGRTADGKTFSQNNIQQAEDYFGLPVNPTPRWLLPATPTKTPIPTSSVRILTLTPTPTLPALDILALNPEVTRVNIFPKHHSYGNFLLFVRLGSAPLNHRLNSFQRGQLSSGWRVYMYQRRADDDYSDQVALVLDDVKDPLDSQYTFLVEITLEEIRNQFWDHRDLVYQIVDEAGKVSWQDEHYLILGLSPPPANHNVDVAEGLVIGYPNLVSEDTARFTHQGKFIPIKEPQGSFYSLSYAFDFIKASGITATSEMEALADGLAITLFPYREDGEYSIENSYALTGEVSAGGYVFQVHFPFDWLSEVFNDDHMFYLRVADSEGNIYKEEYLHFVPYTP